MTVFFYSYYIVRGGGGGNCHFLENLEKGKLIRTNCIKRKCLLSITSVDLMMTQPFCVCRWRKRRLRQEKRSVKPG
jgi:hypothetical protein